MPLQSENPDSLSEPSHERRTTVVAEAGTRVPEPLWAGYREHKARAAGRQTRAASKTEVAVGAERDRGERAAEVTEAKRKCRETGVLPWPSGTLWPRRQLLMKDEKEIKISVYNGNTYVGDTYVDDAYYVANTLLTIPL